MLSTYKTLVGKVGKARIPAHVAGLLAYLSQPKERSNEDLALQYFRHIGGEEFSRQDDAGRADGYVPGSFVLELKGRSNDWLSGLFQGLAYKNKGLDFSQIVVAAKHFLAIWRVEDLPEEMRNEVSGTVGPPNRIGTQFARAYARRRNALLDLAIWKGAERAGTLFQQPDLIAEEIESFEKTLKDGQKVRLKVTLQNFTSVLKEMKDFFDPKQPVKTVRAFYSMLYGWTESATIELSDRVDHKATLGGESITDLVPAKRRQFKDYVENRYIFLAEDDNKDDFFARYDEALDAVDKNFRVRHGIFFTDRSLSKFVMWLVKRHIPNLGKNYLVIDPACGSGNLVTNWRSPLELRHKVVSEIEPELLFAVERRMDGDQWHKDKFTVIPKVDENKGLNFLNLSAEEYLEIVRDYLREKGHNPDKPLAFLCNPPYKNDDDNLAYEKTDKGRTTEGIGYKVHDSIINLTGVDASSERYCCFLAQMKLICNAARNNGLPDDSLLLLFTKSSWLTRRTIFARIRSEMLESFEDVAGILVKGNEFFDVKGSWPVAFSVWRYKSQAERLDRTRSVPLMDLTWLTKKQVSAIAWDNLQEMQKECNAILAQSKEVHLGLVRKSIKEWSGETRKDFIRNRRNEEQNQRIVGGLPVGDERHSLKKAHGETNGLYVGFMDDLTPCRVKQSIPGKPWFRLNAQFMDLRKNRCLSGPPTNRGYCANDLQSARKLFLWYALTKAFLQHSYPMWVDADDLWEPNIPKNLEETVFRMAFAIGYADNECIEARFPANNPVRGLRELSVNNPMTPLDSDSFWSTVLQPYIGRPRASSSVAQLVASVDEVFSIWRKLLKGRTELPISGKAYLIGDGALSLGAGILQIRDYATDNDETSLLAALREIQGPLKVAKTELSEMIVAKTALNYFGSRKSARAIDVPRKQPQRVPAPPAEQIRTRSKPPMRAVKPKPVKVPRTA